MLTKNGFTLIEILVVIVIIGITMGFALISFGDFGQSRTVQFAADRLANFLRVVQQQAVLENTTFGLLITPRQYQLYKLSANQLWQKMPDKKLFKITYFPEKTQIEIKTAIKYSLGTPEIIIYPSGEFSPFKLIFSRKEQPITILNSPGNGYLTFELPKN